MRNTRAHQLACGFNENDLIAEALGETTPGLSQQVHAHLSTCHSCAALLEQYRRLRMQLHSLSLPDSADQGLHEARRMLDTRLAGRVRPRLLLDVWPSPVGDVRIGKTDKGVVLVEFVRPEEGESPAAHWQKAFALESGGPEIAELIRKLEDYLSGKRRDLGWIVDDALMRSDFQREVLRATAEVPYGTAVTYQGIAEVIGQPKAVRAVAQALRYNPVPIHIPCHRVIGSDGSLTGYAGNRIEIKKQILAVEGIPVVETARGLAIPKERMYVGWRHDRWFCLPGCSTLKDQPAGDRTFIPSRARAEEIGYQPCDVCKPHEHPLA
ncbi:MAG: methylated-DNA--[protein]-cysteine S-methyltransferase [Deltaproteobacteria bacterium]|nr:methylated-DNA--[protein]-cysteine S-methyltransferase [Deltaproteobacteria bacterium]